MNPAVLTAFAAACVIGPIILWFWLPNSYEEAAFNELGGLIGLCRAVREQTEAAQSADAAQGAGGCGARDALQELYEFCCQLGDFRPDSRLGRKVAAILAQPPPPGDWGMNYSRAEVLELIRSAYNEGFGEGMREYATMKGGKTWAESRTLKSFDKPAVALPSTQGGGAAK